MNPHFHDTGCFLSINLSFAVAEFSNFWLRNCIRIPSACRKIIPCRPSFLVPVFALFSVDHFLEKPSFSVVVFAVFGRNCPENSSFLFSGCVFVRGKTQVTYCSHRRRQSVDLKKCANRIPATSPPRGHHLHIEHPTRRQRPPAEKKVRRSFAL